MEGGYVTILLLSLKELLVYIIAHELRHHWQHVTPFRKGTGTLCSKLEKEKDADAYAVKQVRSWRKLYAPKDVYPDTNFLF